MSRLKEVIQFCLAVYFGIWTAIGFIILYPGFAFTLSNPKWYDWGHQLRRLWGRWLFLGGLIRSKQFMEEPIDTAQTYVITPNHTSQLDIVTLCVKLKLNFNFMAKAELEKVPVFGIFFRTIDIAVDRKNVRNSALAYQRAFNQLDKKSIVIFPEGTISPTTPKMGRFKDGAFKLAIEKQVPVLPVSIIHNWEILPDQGKFRFRPGTVLQYVHKPIYTKGMNISDLPELKQKVFHIIESKLKEHGY